MRMMITIIIIIIIIIEITIIDVYTSACTKDKRETALYFNIYR